MSIGWFGLSWHHVLSADLVHWVRLPPAIIPTPGKDGSRGCKAAFPEPPPTSTNPKGMQFECQLCAVAAEGALDLQEP
eukprot:scaffold117331_cov16-Tisochrysis_lutea.AAC.1